MTEDLSEEKWRRMPELDEHIKELKESNKGERKSSKDYQILLREYRQQYDICLRHKKDAEGHLKVLSLSIARNPRLENEIIQRYNVWAVKLFNIENRMSTLQNVTENLKKIHEYVLTLPKGQRERVRATMITRLISSSGEMDGV